MKDLRRRETQNLGVIVFIDGRAYSRFAGRRDDGSIDGRRVRAWGVDLIAYRTWVDYWIDLAEERGLDGVEELQEHISDANYYVEPGGERIIGAVDDPNSFADQLFKTLVAEEVAAAPEDASVANLADTAFKRLHIRPYIVTNFEVSLTLKGGTPALIPFDYKYQRDSGPLHLMQNVALLGNAAKPWRSVDTALFFFEKALASELGRTARVKPLAFINCPPDDHSFDGHIAALRTQTPVINLLTESCHTELARELELPAAA
jgi:hypothetical protein